MKKVAICVPSGDMVHADFAIALAAMVYRCGPIGGQMSISGQMSYEYDAIPLAICNVKGSSITNNRNKMVDEARALGVDYMFFVDSDVVLHPWTLRRLLDADKDIVGGTYVQRDEPHRLLGKTVDGVMLDEHMMGRQIHSSELMEVGRLPGGCLLVKMSVFDSMDKPYFQTPTHVESGGETWIEGEDYFFCRQARLREHTIWLDWSVSMSLGHVGQHVNTLPITQHNQEPANAIVH